MRKCLRRMGICFVISIFVWGLMLLSDRQMLRRELIRLHVVAASDSREDQAVKLRVRDAVIQSLRTELQNLADKEAAMAYVQENLPKLEILANRMLRECGSSDLATVSLGVEEFATRIYDTFTLPAGVYDALRITIGPGEGQNWWCVVFPDLCMGAAAEDFEEIAGCAGFSDSLTAALEGKEGYEIRFFLLDVLGRVQNLLHKA